MTVRTWFSRLFVTSSQEMGQVYSYNPGACMEQIKFQVRKQAEGHRLECILHQTQNMMILIFTSLPNS